MSERFGAARLHLPGAPIQKPFDVATEEGVAATLVGREPGFYRRIGATAMDDWTTYRLT